MVLRNSVRLALLVVNLALGYVALAESFDEPLRKTVVDFGRSSYLMQKDDSRVKLSCFYYPEFMVKELNDPGLKGAQIAIVPIVNGRLPACRRSRGAGEQSMTKKGWSGYFTGVKGQLLFLDAADGVDEGMPFAVFDWKTGKKIFQDSVLFWNSGPVDPRVEFTHTPDGKMSMRYMRVVSTDCSIPMGGATCWNKIRNQLGLMLATKPKCVGYEVPGEKKWVLGDEGAPPGELKTYSAIAYPVVVDLFPQPSITAVQGPVKCSPVD
jgi:hypothetical protein